MKSYSVSQEKAGMFIDHWCMSAEEAANCKDIQVSARISPDSANLLHTIQEVYGHTRAEVIRAALDVGLAALMDVRLNRGGRYVRLYDPAVASQIKERCDAYGQPAPPLPVTVAEFLLLEASKPEQESAE
jgi:hypothetical protein